MLALQTMKIGRFWPILALPAQIRVGKRARGAFKIPVAKVHKSGAQSLVTLTGKKGVVHTYQTNGDDCD